jgi:two-component system response regulator AtoC
VARARILHLDSHPLERCLAQELERAGMELVEERGAEHALERLRHEGFDAVLATREAGAQNLLESCRALPDAPPVLLLDGFGSVSDALGAAAAGAFDSIALPAAPEQVLLALQRALGARALSSENRALRARLGERFELAQLVSRDERMRRVFETVEAVADAQVNLLIQGESGTGKTMLARAIHARSQRASGPFVELNCGALPAPLLESELFGHARGAFTGAVREHVGKFEQAHGGTLFLDEISSASLELQVKLLRVLESQRFERVGDERTIQVDVRVIAASNRDLAGEVAAGVFREDLYYRVHVLSIEIPPLRERPADVRLLAERFLAQAAQRHRRPLPQLGSDALGVLLAHAWPGNVRELEHAIERAVLLCSDALVRPADLGPAFAVPAGIAGGPPARAARVPAANAVELAHAQPGIPGAGSSPQASAAHPPVPPLREALAVAEREHLMRALAACSGSRQDAARMLGIDRSTLFHKLRRHGI